MYDLSLVSENKYLNEYLSKPKHKDNRFNKLRNIVESDLATYSAIIDKFLAGESSHSISKRYNKDHKCILKFLNIVGIETNSKKMKSEDLPNIVLDYKNGASISQISKKYGYSTETIKVHLNKNKVDTSYKPILNKEQEKSLVSLYQLGHSTSELSKIFNICKTTVRRIVKNNSGTLRSLSESMVLSIQKYGCNLKGNKIPFQSKKNNRWVLADSSYEVARFIELENDNTVLNYCKSKFKIKYGNHHYTPDIYVEYSNGTKAIEEIKSSWQLAYSNKVSSNYTAGKSIDEISKEFKLPVKSIKKFLLFPIKFKAAEIFCEENNYVFRILVEKDLEYGLGKVNYSCLTKLSTSEMRKFNKANRDMK